MAVEKGRSAPAFTLEDENGEKVALKDYRGKNVIVYFYPKDDTPGCTAEACSIRDSWSTFTSNDIPVYGISGGSSKSHQKFRDKYDLPIPLLMDEEFHIAKLFGVYKKKKMYGKEYMGIERTTFLIDEEGKVEAIFGGPEGIDKVKTKEHANQVIQFWGLKL